MALCEQTMTDEQRKSVAIEYLKAFACAADPRKEMNALLLTITHARC
jgi:hypothetical protein